MPLFLYSKGLRVRELNIIDLFGERIAHTVIPDPRSTEGDVKDTVYQLRESRPSCHPRYIGDRL